MYQYIAAFAMFTKITGFVNMTLNILSETLMFNRTKTQLATFRKQEKEDFSKKNTLFDVGEIWSVL